MSTEQLIHPCKQEVEHPCSGIELMIQPRETSLGEFSVRRVLPSAHKKLIGPWIFFDHMGPAEFSAGSGVNVRPHPHIGLATVTYLFEGEILHRDSLGSKQIITPGDINLMVAGKGIVHSERERPEIKQVDHKMNGLQLWLALPIEDEDTDPAFYHYPASELPMVNVDGVPIRVMMGCAFGLTSPVKTFAKTLYLEADLQSHQNLSIPDCEERALYVVSGEVRAKDSIIPQYSMAVFGDKSEINIQATQNSRVAVIGGEHLGDRFIHWNFVSSQKQKIEEARDKWQSGRFPKVPGDEKEFIPLPS